MWLHRARRLLKGKPANWEREWLEIPEGSLCLLEEGDPVRAQKLARAGIRIPLKVKSTDLEMLGRAEEGLSLLVSGRVAEGMRNLDEVNAAVIGGELTDRIAIGLSGCYLIDCGLRTRARLRSRCTMVQTPERVLLKMGIATAPGSMPHAICFDLPVAWDMVSSRDGALHIKRRIGRLSSRNDGRGFGTTRGTEAPAGPTSDPREKKPRMQKTLPGSASRHSRLFQRNSKHWGIGSSITSPTFSIRFAGVPSLQPSHPGPFVRHCRQNDRC